MNKLSEFAAVLTDKYGLSQKDALRFVGLMLDVVRDGLQQERQLKIKGLGTFKVTGVESRESVDVNTGERIVIEGRDKISFTPETALKERVNSPFAQFSTVVLGDGVDFSSIDAKYEEQEETAAAKSEGEERNTETKEIMKPDQPAAPAPVQPAVESAQSPMPSTVQNGDSTTDEAAPAEESVMEPIRTEEGAEDYSDGASSVNNQEESQELSSPAEAPLSPAEAPSSLVDSPSSPAEVLSPSPKVPEAAVEPESSLPQHEEVAEAPVSTEKEAGSSQTELQEASTEPSRQPVQPKEEPDMGWLKADLMKEAQWNEQMEKAESMVRRLRTWLIVVVAVLVLMCGAGAFFGYQQIKQRDAHIIMLETLLTEKTTRLDHKDKAETPQSAAQTAVQTEPKRKTAAQTPPEKNKPQAESEKKEASKPHKDAAAQASSYDSDPRVRTGAYRIVGVQTTVKLRPGQTLESVSKTWLGPGMECYVEAVNGRKDAKAGDVLKIPRLEHKKARK